MWSQSCLCRAPTLDVTQPPELARREPQTRRKHFVLPVLPSAAPCGVQGSSGARPSGFRILATFGLLAEASPRMRPLCGLHWRRINKALNHACISAGHGVRSGFLGQPAPPSQGPSAPLHRQRHDRMCHRYGRRRNPFRCMPNATAVARWRAQEALLKRKPTPTPNCRKYLSPRNIGLNGPEFPACLQ